MPEKESWLSRQLYFFGGEGGGGVALPSSFDDETFLTDVALRQGNIMPIFFVMFPCPPTREKKSCKICLATGYRMCNTTLTLEAKYFDIPLFAVLNYSLCTAFSGLFHSCSKHATRSLTGYCLGLFAIFRAVLWANLLLLQVR